MFNVILAMAGSPSGQPQGNSFISSMIVLVAIFFIFYFLLIRPQQKQQKKLLDMRGSLKKGDRVITSCGIYGTILGITDEIVSLQIAEKVKIEILKSAIAGKREGDDSKKEENK